MLLFRGDGVDALQEAIGILDNLVLAVGRVEHGAEGWPIARSTIDVQKLLGMFELVGCQEILTEAVAQVHIDLVEAALAIAELLEVEIDVLT